VRYEEFIDNPLDTLDAVFHFLNMSPLQDSQQAVNTLKGGNYNKWKYEFTHEQLREIGPVIGDELIKLGYEQDHSWYTSRKEI
jgi:hypothetical protein